ncbi:MAG: HDIG domain-containing protein [Desulfovibrio sp.]|jgi:putative nucleotidyltransferase with HDIG domain|nr:HDIG domain-containing protein [Desulfovibrio sp.]
MMITRNIPDKARTTFSLLWERFGKRLPSKSFFLFSFVIFLLSILASADFSTRQGLLMEGEIAQVEVTADRTFLFEDKQGTKARRALARKMQPLVLDRIAVPGHALLSQIESLFTDINEAHSPEEKEILCRRISRETGEPVSQEVLDALADTPVQNALFSNILPFIEQRLRDGVLSESGIAVTYPGGIIIRDLTSGEERLHTEISAIPDLKNLEFQLSQHIKSLAVSNPAKKILAQIFEIYMRPSLIPNLEATKLRADTAEAAVAPVVHRVLRGEIIISQGERVTVEQQMKMRILLQGKEDRFQWSTCFGICICGLLMALGLLFSPSGKPASPMADKDFLFLSVLISIFALIAKGLAVHGAQMALVSVKFLPESLAYAVPVAGAAALSAQVFSTRRYLVTGLLLSFFCSLMMKGGIGLFLFYFLATMWSTWLTSRCTSRRDVVWSVLPLTAGLIAMWAGATLLQSGSHTRYFSECISLVAGATFSMILTFALTPIVEMTFGYTTRFRLMELLNIEQPLLRDLMIKAPGTYHHSLIVSNMVEAGAKQIGAYSLLCKVAALYHDIGKLTKADYFIENQSTDDNPHNRLAPSMSALILVAHVKQGVELGIKHRLGPEVTDVIRQHHGTSLIKYFYQKAMNQPDTPPPNIEDYCYPGPRPRSREAALVMLADIVEASSRTLDELTPTRLRQHIDTTVKNIYSSGQLDESELTFKDLNLLVDSFHQVLRGIFHHRISYPEHAGKQQQAKNPQFKASTPPSATSPPGKNNALPVSGFTGTSKPIRN